MTGGATSIQGRNDAGGTGHWLMEVGIESVSKKSAVGESAARSFE
jgi:hypothetical protein